MARKIIAYGTWYVAYEIGSSVMALGALWTLGLSPV